MLGKGGGFKLAFGLGVGGGTAEVIGEGLILACGLGAKLGLKLGKRLGERLGVKLGIGLA
jgi:hypothetical protein